MARYEVTAPDGKRYEVEGPEGATQQQLIAIVKQKQREQTLSREQSLFATGENGPGIASGLAGSVAQGMSFGFADELAAGLRGAVAAPGEGTFSDTYDQAHFESELARTRFGKAHPNLSIGGEIGGGIGTGGAALSFGKTALRNIPAAGRLTGIGAAEGALFGAGTADPGERLKGAAIGAGIGAIGGPVVGGGLALGASALRPVARKLGESLFETPRNQAVRIINGALAADDITAEEAFTLLQKMENGTIADLGENTQRAARLATSQQGPAASRARTFLDDRQAGQQRRLTGAARGAAGDFDRGVMAIVEGARTRAKPFYDEAYSARIEVTPALDELLKRPAVVRAKRKALGILRNEGISGEVGDVQYLDAIKRNLDDQIGAALRAGKNNEVRILTNLKREFVGEIDSQVPAYAQARKIFSDEAGIRDAADLGRTVLRPSTDAANLAETVQGMAQSELTAFRSGVLRALADSFEARMETSNVAKRLVETPRLRKVLQLAFPDQGAFRKFLQTAQAESKFSQTRNTVLGGSPTARIQADREAAGALLPRAIDAVASPGTAIADLMKSITGNKNLTPEVLDEMAKLLFDPDVIPKRLKSSRAVNAFDIPVMNPSVFSGRVGGAVGSQVPQSQSDKRRRRLIEALQTGDIDE